MWIRDKDQGSGQCQLTPGVDKGQRPGQWSVPAYARGSPFAVCIEKRTLPQGFRTERWNWKKTCIRRRSKPSGRCESWLKKIRNILRARRKKEKKKSHPPHFRRGAELFSRRTALIVIIKTMLLTPSIGIPNSTMAHILISLHWLTA